MKNSLGKTVNTTLSVCSKQKFQVSQEETFCSAKYSRNEKEKKKKTNLDCFQFHRLDTLRVLLGDMHTHPWTWGNPKQTMLDEPSGFSPSTVQDRKISTTPGTGKQPTHALQSSLWAHQPGTRQISPSKAVCCHDLCPRGLMAPCLDVWCLLPGLHYSHAPARMATLLVHNSNASWWELWWRLLVTSPHHGTLDQEADEMEVLVGACGWNLPEGEQQGEMKKWWHSYSTSAPCSWETKPRHTAEKKKWEEAPWIPNVLQWLWRKHKICPKTTPSSCRSNTCVHWSSFYCLSTVMKDNIS